jgi:predicted transcriptional regulator
MSEAEDDILLVFDKIDLLTKTELQKKCLKEICPNCKHVIRGGITFPTLNKYVNSLVEKELLMIKEHVISLTKSGRKKIKRIKFYRAIPHPFDIFE